jgi:hypothetical protein
MRASAEESNALFAAIFVYKTSGGGSPRDASCGGLSNPMIPFFMLLFSAAALIQFFVSYCRSILATYAKMELSVATREVAGIESDRIPSGEFGRLLGILRLARDPGDDRMELLTVRLYYSFVRLLGVLGVPFVTAAKDWSEREGGRCAYFAAVALDRRIASVTR